MILYNVTIGVDKEIETEWVNWMRDKHIPAVLKTGAFVRHEFYKVLSHEDKNTVSYCTQYFSPTIEKFNLYLKDHAPKLVEWHREKFKNKHIAFRTLLEKI